MNRVLLASSLAVAFLISLASAWLIPPFAVTAVIDSVETKKVRFRSGRESLITKARPYASEQKIEIENRSQGASSPVCFGAPQAAFGGTLRLSFFRVVSGDWKADEKAQTWCSSTPGSVVALEQRFSSLVIPFLPGSGGAAVRLSHNGASQDLSLVTSKGSQLERKLRSPLSEIYAYTRNGCAPISIVGAAPTVRVLKASLLDRLEKVAAFEGPTPANRWSFSPEQSSLKSWLRVMGYSAGFSLRLVFVGILFLCIGLILLAPVVGGLKGVENIFFPIIVGQAICATAMSCLGMFGWTFREGFTLVSLTALVVVVSALVRSPRSVGAVGQALSGQLKSSRREIGCVLLVVFLGLFAVLQPIFLLKGWYVGEAYTDTWWYLNVSQILTDVSTRVHEPSLWSFQRMADLASISLVALIARSGVVEAYDLHLALSWVLFSLGVYCSALRLGLSRGYAMWALALSAFSASLFSLAAESYFAQFFFVQLLVGGLAITLFSLDRLREQGTWRRAGIASVASVYACALSVYPYHFVLPAAVAFVCGVCWLTGQRRMLPWLVSVGCVSLLLLNVNVLVTLNFGSNAYLMTALNDIARYIVFPFYGTLEHLSVSFSLDDFHRHSVLLPEVDKMFWGRKHEFLSRAWGDLETIRQMLVYCVAVALALGGIALAWTKDAKRHVLLVFSILYIALTAWSYQAGQVYSYCKVMMTVGPLVPLIALLGMERVSSFLRGRIPEIVVSMVCGFWLIVSMVSVLPSLFVQESYRGAPFLIKTRTHASVIGSEEMALARELASSPSNGAKVLLFGYPVDYSKSDKDRVLLYFLRNVTEGRRLLSNDSVPLSWHGRDYQGDLPLDRWLSEFNEPGAHYVVAFHEPPAEVRETTRMILSTGIYDVYQKLSDTHQNRAD